MRKTLFNDGPSASDSPFRGKNYFSHQLGISLIEVLVTSAISVIILLFLTGVFVNSKGTGDFLRASSGSEQRLNLALDVIKKDSRMSGFMGCLAAASSLSVSSVNTISLTAIPDAQQNLMTGRVVNGLYPYIEGINDHQPGDTWIPSGLNSPNDLAILTGTDSVIFRLLNPNQRLEVATSQTAEGDDIVTNFVPEAGATPTPLIPNSIYSVSDCSTLDLFMAGANSNISVITHNAFSTTYEAGSELMPLYSVIYYLAANADNDNSPALFRRLVNGNGAARVDLLIDNVEQMQILYAADQNLNGQLDDDERFVTADALTSWRNLLAMQIGLIVRSDEQNASDNVAALQQQEFLGETVTFPDDGYLRSIGSVVISTRQK